MPDSLSPQSSAVEQKFLPSMRVRAFAVAFMTFTVVAMGFFKFVWLRSNLTIKSYEDCTKAKGSTILESYPAICISRTGVRFIQPLTPEEQAALKPPAPPIDLREFAMASNQDRLFTTTDNALSLTLLRGWVQVQPDQSVEPAYEDVKTLEFMKSGETRGYPLGRVTVQYTKESDRLNPESSVFEPQAERLGTIDYLVVSGEESGGLVEAYQYLVYYGTFPELKLSVRLFVRFTSQEELGEQKEILSSLMIPAKLPEVESTP